MDNPFAVGTEEWAAWEDSEAPADELRELPAMLASTVKTRRIRWAWRGRIPFGKLSTVEGDPGDGKSLMTLDLAARWSSGKPMPDGWQHDGPYHVILVSAEDDEDDTITPRLTVAGAQLDHVTLITGGRMPDSPFTFGADLAALERRIIATGTRIVIFDPLTAFMSSNVDSHNDLSVRHALWPLKALAQRTGCAIIVVRHLNKGGTGVKAIYRGNGSIAFIGAARCGHAVARDPDDEPDGRLLATVKSNISRLPDTLRFRVESTPDGETPYVAWGGVSGLTAQQALDGPRRQSHGDDQADMDSRVRQYEREFLLDVLAAGPMPWKDIVEAGRVDGFSARTLERARAEAGLIKVMGTDGQASVRWARPSTSDVQVARNETPFRHSAIDLGPKTRAIKPWRNGEMADGELSPTDRDAAIDSADLRCYACDSCDAIRFYGPWWTIACADHAPDLNGGHDA